ncbi:MAG: galactose ABC transporter substrate-binding protein [Oscillospiraceae bacterium]|nr:galactose ABC transporter substrate-binding protein [Oscillospiraceae bacterium]
MKTRKILAVLLAVSLVVSLAACGGGGSTTATTSAIQTTQAQATTAAQQATDESIKIDVFWYTFSDTYLTSVRNAMIQELDASPSIKYTMHDCEEDQAKQTEMVRTAITQGTNLLVVNIVTTGSDEAAQNIVDQAKENNIPIIFFNREVSDSIVNSYDKCAFVGTDADEAGYMQGEAVAKFLLDGDNLSRYDLDGDNEIKYIMFRGEHGNAEAFGRTKYAVTEANRLLEPSGVKLVPSPANETSTQYDNDGISNYFLYGNWSAKTAADLMRTALTAYSLTDGTIELILANNDDQALGAIEAMNEEGFNTGSGATGYIPVFGVDATTVATEAIGAGRMTGTILQDGPAMASCIVALAKNIANGADLMANTGNYNIDAGVAKIRIPYAIVSQTAQSQTPPAAQQAGGESVKIDVFWYTFSDTYLTSVRNAMIQELDASPNIKYTMHDCEEDQAKQTEMVRTAITQGTNLLVVNIVTTGSDEAAQNIVDQAKENNIPIIFFNREVSDSIVNSYDKCAFVGTDADEAGYMQGEAVAKFLLDGDNLSKYDLDGDNEIKYIMFRGEHGNAEAFGRTKYSVTEANRLLEPNGVKLVPSPANETSTQYDDDGISNYFLYGNWSAKTAADLMRTALVAYSLTDGTIELILANNDDQALGAIEAMNEEGFNTGSGATGYIPVFGVDATTVATEAIGAGRMTGTILQDGPAMAGCIVALAKNIANGNDLMANTGNYNIDAGVAKIRIPYAIVS